MMLVMLLGCQPEGPACGETIVLAEAANYAYTGTIDVPSIPTAPAADLDICWDAVADDIRCHEVDPAADIDNVGMVRFGSLGQPEVEEGLGDDSLDQADISGYLEWNNDAAATCTTLGSLSFFGTPVDVTEEYTVEGGTYMLILTTGTEPGVGARVLTFLEPDASSENTRVDVPTGCGALDFSVDLGALEQPGVCAEGPWDVDWTGITGEDTVDGLMLGFYEGMDADDLAADFLDIEQNATRIWRMTLDGGTSASLTDALDDGGAAFSGFSGEGSWVLALTCSRCYSPAPPFLTLLDVSG